MPARIVVVDDDEALRNAVRRVLRLEGDDVEIAVDGAEGLAQLADLGADLVVLDVRMPVLDTKPFAVEELSARVRALLRRSRPDHDGAVVVGDVELHPRTRRVHRGDRAIELTRTEFALLELLVRNADTVLTRDVIRERVWGFEDAYGSNTLDVYVGYLRRKTEAGGAARMTHTVRGVRFVLRDR